MKKFFILLGLIVLLSVSVLAADVSKVGDWWGTVTINGNDDTDGAIVSAYIDSIKVASTIVGQYVSGYYLIHVEGDSGDEILFKVNGVDATTFYWASGDHRLDLNVSISSSSDDSPSDGGGSSGGGGGSSGSGGSSGGSSTSTSSTSSSTSEEKKENETININETEESSSTSFLTGAVTGLGKFTKSGAGRTSIIILVIIGGAALFFNFKKKFVKKTGNYEEEKEESSEDKEEDSSKEESENNSEEETNEENQNA